MKASREKQERFMAGFGDRDWEIRKAVENLLIRKGPAWLTDEQMAEVVSYRLRTYRFSQRLARENRRMAAE